MKEIYYYGDLNEDIKKAKKSEEKGNIFLYSLDIFLYSLFCLIIDLLAMFTYSFCGMDIITIKFSFLFVLVPVQIITLCFEIIKEKRAYRTLKKEREKANKNIYVLSRQLNKEYKVNLSKIIYYLQKE